MRSARFIPFLEIAAVFAVFCRYGAWKVSDSNEAHYIGKALTGGAVSDDVYPLSAAVELDFAIHEGK